MNIWPWSRIHQLERQVEEANDQADDALVLADNAKRDTAALRNQVDYLIREIRKMDDIIFSIGQSADGSWSRVQPRFAQLHDEMTARKVAESNRINSLITSELHNTYRPDEPKQIGQSK